MTFLVDFETPFKSTILPFPLIDMTFEFYKKDLESSFGRAIDKVLPVRDVDKPGLEPIPPRPPPPLLSLPGVNYFNLWEVVV